MSLYRITLIDDLVFPKIYEANEKAGWNYEVDWAEACQFTKYGLNQFYGWHTDGSGDHMASYSTDKDRNKKLYNIEKTPFTDNKNCSGTESIVLYERDSFVLQTTIVNDSCFNSIVLLC